MNFILNKIITDIFREYFQKNGYLFEDAPEICEGEHNLVYYNLFKEYLELYESTLTNYLDTLGVNINEFYQDVREAQEETTDIYLKNFIGKSINCA